MKRKILEYLSLIGILLISLTYVWDSFTGQKISHAEGNIVVDLITMRTTLSNNSNNIQQRRLAALHKFCNETGRNATSATGFFLSTSANMAICHVAKAGSSFCGQVIVALDESKNKGNVLNAFRMDRSQVHFHKRISEKELINKSSSYYFAKRVIVARNPFTRLYSGYVDKFFLLHAVGRSVRKAYNYPYYYMNSRKCGYNISFSDFLNNVASGIIKGITINEHMRPVSLSCSLCVVQYDYVALKETLSRDLKDILQELLPSNQSEYVNEYLTKDWNTVTLESLVNDQYSNYFYYVDDCPNITDYLEKLWLSLKIQGYIHKSLPFPISSFFGREVTKQLVLQTVMSAKFQIPMDEEAIEKQRLEYLKDAYFHVKRNIVEAVVLAFKDDFEAFGYSKFPPNMVS